MNRKFTDLSKLKFDEIEEGLKDKFIEQKIQERPFTYEFYHQFRKMWDSGSIVSIVSSDVVIQAEVNKIYQGIPECEKIPDFLLHKPSAAEKNYAVMEFKLASNHSQLKNDFNKLVKFRQILNYEFLIEVVIGKDSDLRTAINKINKLKTSSGDKIIIICFNTEIWKANDFEIKYDCI